MSDPVERLRAASHDERLSTGMLYREAADEIERLRARIVEHEQFRHQHRDCDAMGVENQALRAKVAKLECTEAQLHALLIGLEVPPPFWLAMRPEALTALGKVITDQAKRAAPGTGASR